MECLVCCNECFIHATSSYKICLSFVFWSAATAGMSLSRYPDHATVPTNNIYPPISRKLLFSSCSIYNLLYNSFGGKTSTNASYKNQYKQNGINMIWILRKPIICMHHTFYFSSSTVPRHITRAVYFGKFA